MDKLLKAVLILTAVDRMSSVVGAASDKSIQKLNGINSAVKNIGEGMLLLEARKKGFGMLEPALDAYEEMELAGAKLKASMMSEGGMLNKGTYDKMVSYAQMISDHYSGSTADYLDMMRVMKNNSVSESDILSGIGVGVEKLGLLFNMKPAAIGEFAAHMRNDMGVAVKDMERVMDLTARIHNVGVGKTGEEAVYEMNQFFSKVGLGLVNLKTTGMQASQEIGALGAIFMRKGISGESVGTNFRRILDGLRDPQKIQKANDEAKKFGKTLEFFDSAGKFKGIAEFTAEIGKLKGLPTNAIAEILKPFSGRQGLSTDFLELLAHTGVDEFNHMQKALMTQATLDQKIAPILATYSKQKQVLASTWENTKAAIGAVMIPKLIQWIKFLNEAAVSLRKFIGAHPALTKMLVGTVALFSSMLMLAGVVKIAVGAFQLLSILKPILGVFRLMAFLASGVVWPLLQAGAAAAYSGFITMMAWLPTIGIFVLIGLVIYGVYKIIVKHFGSLGNFFRAVWAKVKEIFFAFVWPLIKFMMLFNPITLIIVHWKKITTFFSALWGSIKIIFWDFVAWVFNLQNVFFNAGSNIIKSITSGIKAFVNHPIEAIKGMVQKIRNLLPFSPAKDGPLKDIHRIKLVETIAEGINPAVLTNKMRGTLGMMLGVTLPRSAASVAGYSGGGGGVNVTYAPVFHFAPGTSSADATGFMNEAKKHAREMVDILEAEINKRRRTLYS